MSILGLSTRRKIALARVVRSLVWASRRVAGSPMHGTFTRQRLRWALDLNEGIDFSIYLMGAFERRLLQCYTRLVSPNAVVLDLGANVGAHTLPLARLVGPGGKVVAVEATAYAFAKLRANLALNPELIPGVTLVHALLVAQENGAPATTDLYSSWSLLQGGDIHPIHRGTLKPLGPARVLTTDRLVDEQGLTPVEWIKLDVDGHELAVLEGAKQTLARYHPAIFMELAPDYYAAHPGEFAALLALLWAEKYQFYLPGEKQPLPTAIAELEALIPTGGGINVLARVGN